MTLAARLAKGRRPKRERRWKMRNILFLAVAAVLLSPVANAESKSAAGAEGLACFENLAVPDFPHAALQEHVDGSVWTWTHVSPQGTVDKIDTQVVSAWGQGPKILTPPVEKAIRAAKIKSDCAGKTVWVVFTYQLHGDATASPKVTSRTEPPNIMWIESQPALSAVAKAKS
jgi:hypothetical protein